MKSNKAKIVALGALAAAAALTAVGCNNKERQKEQDAFFPDKERSSVNAYAEAQSAAGARSDSMLYPHHFDGGELNSLGKQKLALMLADPRSARPMTVYMVNWGEGDIVTKRQTVVRDYLKDAMRPEEKVEFVAGINPNTYHPAAEAMLHREGSDKIETAVQDSASSGK